MSRGKSLELKKWSEHDRISYLIRQGRNPFPPYLFPHQMDLAARKKLAAEQDKAEAERRETRNEAGR